MKFVHIIIYNAILKKLQTEIKSELFQSVKITSYFLAKSEDETFC